MEWRIVTLSARLRRGMLGVFFFFLFLFFVCCAESLRFEIVLSVVSILSVGNAVECFSFFACNILCFIFFGKFLYFCAGGVDRDSSSYSLGYCVLRLVAVNRLARCF